MKKYALICALILSQFLSAEQKKFTIGTTSGYAPYVSLNNKGEYEGFDIDLAKLIAEKLNRKLEIADLGSMPSLMIGLKQKRVDALIWAISITEERNKQMEMIYYQGKKIDSMPLLFWGEIPEGIRGPGDLTKPLCVEAGSYQEQVMETFPGLKLKNVDKISDALLEIRFGKSVAIAVDSSLVDYLKGQNPQLQVLQVPLPEAMQSQGNGICVNRCNPELAREIRAAVEELSREGKIAELEKRWKLEE